MEMQLSDPGSFVLEKQNEEVDITKILISKEQLNWKNFTDSLIQEILKDPSNPRFGALDPSLGKKSSSGDYSCIVTIVRDLKSGYLFVVDINLKRRSTDDQIDAIIERNEKFHYKLFAVETNAFQYVVAENLRKKSREQGAYVNVTNIDNYQDKKMRFEGILPLLLDGTIVFDKIKYNNNQQYNLGIEQICSFTGENDRHDDTPDSLEMCVRIAKKPKFKMLTRQTER